MSGGESLSVSFDVTNSGACAGTDTPQIYLDTRNGSEVRRLLGWSRLELKSGETRRVTVTTDLRLLADFDPHANAWRIEAGDYSIAVGSSAEELVLRGAASMAASVLRP